MTVHAPPVFDTGSEFVAAVQDNPAAFNGRRAWIDLRGHTLAGTLLTTATGNVDFHPDPAIHCHTEVVRIVGVDAVNQPHPGLGQVALA